ncbi:MAG: GNAT family N-acetyltransferase [Chloroflexota bacterium]
MDTDTGTLYQTERLTVRRLTADDFDAMYTVYSDVEAMRWVDDGQPISREECAMWIEVTQSNYANYGYGMSAIELRLSGLVIGFCGLVHPGGQEKAEIKYAFLREFWGQGLATEMAKGMLEYGQRTFGLSEVIATIAPDHVASQRVMLKVGMKHVETLHNDDGSLTNLFVWTRRR